MEYHHQIGERVINLKFKAEVWCYPGKSAWHFVTLPHDIASEIKFFREKHRGFGSIRALVKVGRTSWKTSLFPDKKSGSYFLPIKAEIRKKENITNGNKIKVSLIAIV
jgi:hypothetical protein